MTEHVLIDEAQDTNPEQWAIIRALAEEFFAGDGSHGERIRTLFTVGDFKQAIFGFQGTDPRYFGAAELSFGRLAEAAWDSDSAERARTGEMRARPWHRRGTRAAARCQAESAWLPAGRRARGRACR